MKSSRPKFDAEAYRAKVLEMARAAGAEVVLEHGEPVFLLDTPIGRLRGHIIFGHWIAMRFDDPGDKVPEIASGDFNRYSHKWNIQGYPVEATLEEFARRLVWICGHPVV